MNRDRGFEESFKEAKMVYLTTIDGQGKETTRPMTNYSDNPYGMIWFPTERKTQKVQDILKNPKVKILVPSKKKGFFYQIEGSAKLEDEEVVKEKWRWWYLTWRPTQSRWFWFPAGLEDNNRVIVNVYPENALLIEKRS
jgi:general stress protein 26